MAQKAPNEINDKENSVNRETKPSDPEYFTISFYTHDDHQTGVLYDILSALNIHDIELFYDDHGTLIAVDDDNRWVGAEFYTFLMEDAFVYEENGSVLGIRDNCTRISRHWRKKTAHCRTHPMYPRGKRPFWRN